MLGGNKNFKIWCRNTKNLKICWKWLWKTREFGVMWWKYTENLLLQAGVLGKRIEIFSSAADGSRVLSEWVCVLGWDIKIYWVNIKIFVYVGDPPSTPLSGKHWFLGRGGWEPHRKAPGGPLWSIFECFL